MADARPVVVITGGSSGIGAAVARAFAADHAVALIARDEARLRAVAGELGPGSLWRKADVGRREEIASAIASIAAQLGRIDVLVVNAGFSRGVSVAMPLDEAERLWDEVHGANLKGAFLTALAAVTHLARPGGRIINIGSIAARTGGSLAGSIAYASAKSGIDGLTFALARELGPQGITVNAIAPGFIADTRFHVNPATERLARVTADTPVRRLGCAEDVAGAVRYLASPGASFVNGAVLSVNGGLLMG